MKQLTLRIDDGLHAVLLDEANSLNKSLTEYITELTCRRGKIYTTNHDHQIQLHVSITYLGDLLILGRIKTFEGICEIMKEAIENGEIIILERPYQNSPPNKLGELKTMEDFETWKGKITSIR